MLKQEDRDIPSEGSSPSPPNPLVAPHTTPHVTPPTQAPCPHPGTAPQEKAVPTTHLQLNPQLLTSKLVAAAAKTEGQSTDVGIAELEKAVPSDKPNPTKDNGSEDSNGSSSTGNGNGGRVSPQQRRNGRPRKRPTSSVSGNKNKFKLTLEMISIKHKGQQSEQ